MNENGRELCIKDSSDEFPNGNFRTREDWFRHIMIKCDEESNDCPNSTRVMSCTVCTEL